MTEPARRCGVEAPPRVGGRGFTLLELLVVVGVVGLLIGLLVPALGRARGAARMVQCLSNERQLVTAWQVYANDYDDRAMPLAYTDSAQIGDGPAVYWWGTNESGTIDHGAGFLSPYLEDGLRESSVYECPEQPWGSYDPQGLAEGITSTYGYNGYYLCPPFTPGWKLFIGKKAWKRLARVERPCDVMVFADTLLGSDPPTNNALLDPPMIWFSGGGWQVNSSPTTCFRHGGSAAAVHADGSARGYRAAPGWLTHPDWGVGSVGVEPGLHYVPDWERW